MQGTRARLHRRVRVRRRRCVQLALSVSLARCHAATAVPATRVLPGRRARRRRKRYAQPGGSACRVRRCAATAALDMNARHLERSPALSPRAFRVGSASVAPRFAATAPRASYVRSRSRRTRRCSNVPPARSATQGRLRAATAARGMRAALGRASRRPPLLCVRRAGSRCLARRRAATAVAASRAPLDRRARRQRQ